MKPIFFSLSVFSLIVFSVRGQSAADLQPKDYYGQEAKVVVRLLDNNHYSKLKLDDSLSSAILDAYLSDLDDNRVFFLASDIQSFQKFRYAIDDDTYDEDVSPAYVIYNVFAKRFKERMDYVMNNLINHTFDFTKDEFYESDRSKSPWATTPDELNDLWRKIIKSQALSLKLTGKDSKSIQETLKKRYDRQSTSMDQFRTDDVFAAYMNAITESYDPHTNYFSENAADVFQENMNLSLEGIGARLQTENDYTKVIEVLPGGPAEKSNKIHVNDRIVGVAQGDDGEMVDVIGWRVDDVVKLIKGPKGTVVRLQMLPAESGLTGQTVVIRLVRDKIMLDDMRAKKDVKIINKDGKALKLGVITLPSFYLDFDAYQRGDSNYVSTTRDVKALIEELKAEDIDGLVIDLRNNPGGSLLEAINMTGLFIKDGPVVQVKSSNNHVDVMDDNDPTVSYTGPLVILTNRFSASASEIFSGAIQDYHRGVIVGESTYGKGTVQTIVDLNRYLQDADGDAGDLKITFQKFYRITGSSTQHKGVTPDVALPSALAPEQYGESSNPSALPWDEIGSSLYQKTGFVNDKTIAALNKSYQNRLQQDSSLARFVRETKATRKRINETQISLNEAERRKEQDALQKQTSANKLTAPDLGGNGEVDDTTDSSNNDDEYLRQGLLVLADLITSKIG